MSRVRTSHLLLALALGLAGGAGLLSASALGVGQQATRTTTINVATGARGPAGPPGPPGPTGPRGLQGPPGMVCPAGFEPTDVVINHPSGQLTAYVCVKQ